MEPENQPQKKLRGALLKNAFFENKKQYSTIQCKKICDIHKILLDLTNKVNNNIDYGKLIKYIKQVVRKDGANPKFLKKFNNEYKKNENKLILVIALLNSVIFWYQNDKKEISNFDAN